MSTGIPEVEEEEHGMFEVRSVCLERALSQAVFCGLAAVGAWGWGQGVLLQVVHSGSSLAWLLLAMESRLSQPPSPFLPPSLQIQDTFCSSHGFAVSYPQPFFVHAFLLIFCSYPWQIIVYLPKLHSDVSFSR